MPFRGGVKGIGSDGSDGGGRVGLVGLDRTGSDGVGRGRNKSFIIQHSAFAFIILRLAPWVVWAPWVVGWHQVVGNTLGGRMVPVVGWHLGWSDGTLVVGWHLGGRMAPLVVGMAPWVVRGHRVVVLKQCRCSSG